MVTHFPFSDLKSTIKRPALILANLEGKDVILCQITKVERKDKNKVSLDQHNLKTGNLKLKSFIRPSRLFTIEKSLISYKIGSLKENKLSEVIKILVEVFTS